MTTHTYRTRKTPIAIAIQLGEALGEPLTDREIEIVHLILAGHVTQTQLRQRLNISERTVQSHLYHIYAKTGAVNMVELVLMAAGYKPSPVCFASPP